MGDPPHSGDVLTAELAKYSLLRNEVWKHIEYYKGHVKHLQLFGGALVGGIGFLLTHTADHLSADTWCLWYIGILGVSIVTNYLILDIADAQFGCLLIAARMATHEEALNAMLKKPVFLWESVFAPRFYALLRPIPGVLSPNWLLRWYASGFAFLVGAVAPIIGFLWLMNRVESAAITSRFLIIVGICWAFFLTSYTIRVTVVNGRVLRRKAEACMRSEIARLSGPLSDSKRQRARECL